MNIYQQPTSHHSHLVHNMYNHNTIGLITKMTKNELNKYILELNNDRRRAKKELSEKK